jgi:Ser/Thr protein kinase RdoA (MazF antagonist)
MIIEAEKVLLQYSFVDPIIEFIRHNENITFKVINKLDNKKYLLRIHKPISEGFSGLQHTRDGLQAEMFFLREMGQKNILKVQRPVVNQKGELVTEYNSEQFGTSLATLLEWIDGSTLTQEEDNIEQIIYRLGENIAHLHEFSRTLMPLELHRPVYDVEKIDETLIELRQGANHGVLEPEDYDVISSVLFVVKEQLAELDARDDSWGFIHADFQLGNVVVSEQNPILIDYCLFGYGYYLFDLGSASSMLRSELRKTLLDGYASKSRFSLDEIRYIEGQIFMDIFISYVFFIHDSERNGWIKEHASKICSTLCRDFLEGKEVYYLF